MENKFLQEEKKIYGKCKEEKDKSEFNPAPKATAEREKGKLEDKIMTLDEIRAEEARLRTIRARLEAENVQKGKKVVRIDDWSQLTAQQRESNKTYYEIVDKNNNTIYEFHGGQISTLFGKEDKKRRAFFDGLFDLPYDYDNRQITFLYREHTE